RRAYFQRNATLDEQLDDARIFERTNAVSDAFCAQQLHGIAHRRRAVDFTGVRHDVKSFATREIEALSEKRGGKPSLVAAEADADDAVFLPAGNACDGLGCFLRTEIARDIADQRD